MSHPSSINPLRVRSRKEGCYMARTFVGLALSSTMFQEECLVVRMPLNLLRVQRLLMDEVVSCVNPSHQATLDALRERFGIEIPIPETAPKVTLEPGDTLVTLSARFSRRLAEGEKYSAEEVAAATFEFVAYAVIDPVILGEDTCESIARCLPSGMTEPLI
jgi:hypothetical protein